MVTDRPEGRCRAIAFLRANSVERQFRVAKKKNSELATEQEWQTWRNGTARRLRKLRESRGISIADAARYIGVQPITWAKWEAAKANISDENAGRAGQLLGAHYCWITGEWVHDEICQTRSEMAAHGLRDLQKRDKLTDSQAAKKSGVSTELWKAWTYWRVQQRITDAQAAKVAAAFGVPVQLLLGWGDEIENQPAWGKRLADLRAKRGWSIERVAKAINYSFLTIEQWELSLGSPDLRAAFKLAKLYGDDLQTVFAELAEAEA